MDGSRGELCARVQWVYDESFTGRSGERVDMAADEGVAASATDGDVLKSAADREKAKADAMEAYKKLAEEREGMSIPDGDYQVQVHIIEARDLKAEDLCGTSDPIVFAEVRPHARACCGRLHSAVCVRCVCRDDRWPA